MSEEETPRRQSRKVSMMRSKEMSVYGCDKLEPVQEENLYHAGKKLEVEVPKHQVGL